MDSKLKADIKGAINKLAKTYFPKNYNIRKLKGLEHTYRLRVGNQKIIYNVDFANKHIFILSIIKREEAYKKR